MTLLDNVIGKAATARRPTRDVRGVVGPETAGKKAPRTQDEVMVAATRDDCLILRDYSVVAAVGVGSIDDTLLSARELEIKRLAFREMLKQMRFEAQLLIGTRPQNLSRYRLRIEERMNELETRRLRLEQFRELVPGYVERVLGTGRTNEADFETYFGWSAAWLRGTPGLAPMAARRLIEPDLAAGLKSLSKPDLARFIAARQDGIQISIDFVAHWQSVIRERGDFLEATLRDRYAPVRTFLLVTAYNPRLVLKSVRHGPMGEDEFRAAHDELARRCAFLLDRVGRMGLPVWRASSDELLLDVSLFYHPSNPELHRRDLRYERSLATQRAAMNRGAGG